MTEGGQGGRRRRQRGGLAQVLSERFPHLAAAGGLDPRLRADLMRTERELGSVYRRGKAQRLAELRRLELELEVTELRAQTTALRKTSDLVHRVLNDSPPGLSALLAQPLTESQARTCMYLAFLRHDVLHKQDAPYLDLLLDHLLTWSLDPNNVATLRADLLMLRVERKDLSLTRQARYERRRRLRVRMSGHDTVTRFALLVETVRAASLFSEAEQQGTVHPLLSILRLTPAPEFPSVIDVVAIANWLVSNDESLDVKTR